MYVAEAAPAPAEAVSTTGRRRALCLRLTLLFVALGLTCRVAQYLSARSLWQDEAYVVMNLRAKSPAQLLGPLDARPHTPQAAPPGFLLIEKFVYDRVGVVELPLRAVAQVLGLLALPLFARLAWQLLGPRPAAFFAVGVFALSDELIAHAAEIKQYSGDAFFAVLLLWIATRDGPRSDGRRLWAVTLTASLGIWFSYPVVFVAAGISAAFFISRPRGVATFVLAHVPLICSAAALYLLCVRHQQAANLYDQWADHLANWHKPLTVPLFVVVQTYALANYAAASAGPIVLPLAIVGAVALWRTQALGWPMAVLLLAPVALCLAAALIGRYPYGGARTSAFLTGPVCLLAGAGFGVLVASRHRAVQRSAQVISAVAAAILLVQCAVGLALPRTRSHLRPVIAYLREHRRPADHVWVVGGAPSDIYRCYVDPPDALTRFEIDRDHSLPPLPVGRTWLVFAGSPDRLDRKTTEPRLADARRVATQVDAFTVRGGAAYLFEKRP